MDICIVTYNRLVYLRKCIDSLIASGSGNRIFVIDDCSTDGTKQYLFNLKERGLIHEAIINPKNMGTAWNFNTVIRKSESEVFMMCNDDMWFHRGWKEAVMEIYEEKKDCGIVSFYDYTRYNLDGGKVLSDTVRHVPRTGLGACIMNRKLFEAVGGFYLPNGRLMGYFATPFCKKVQFFRGKFPRMEHYATIPHYATHMDLRTCGLHEKDYLEDYITHRKKHKKNQI